MAGHSWGKVPCSPWDTDQHGPNSGAAVKSSLNIESRIITHRTFFLSISCSSLPSSEELPLSQREQAHVISNLSAGNCAHPMPHLLLCPGPCFTLVDSAEPLEEFTFSDWLCLASFSPYLSEPTYTVSPTRNPLSSGNLKSKRTQMYIYILSF